MKRATKAELLKALRMAVTWRAYRGSRLVGRRCDLCGVRWKGLKEKHEPGCILSEERT